MMLRESHGARQQCPGPPVGRWKKHTIVWWMRLERPDFSPSFYGLHSLISLSRSPSIGISDWALLDIKTLWGCVVWSPEDLHQYWFVWQGTTCLPIMTIAGWYGQVGPETCHWCNSVVKGDNVFGYSGKIVKGIRRPCRITVIRRSVLIWTLSPTPHDQHAVPLRLSFGVSCCSSPTSFCGVLYSPDLDREPWSPRLLCGSCLHAAMLNSLWHSQYHVS